MWYRNVYHCPCGNSWADEWFSMCDDECSECRRDVSPTEEECVLLRADRVYEVTLPDPATPGTTKLVLADDDDIIRRYFPDARIRQTDLPIDHPDIAVDLSGKS